MNIRRNSSRRSRKDQEREQLSLLSRLNGHRLLTQWLIKAFFEGYPSAFNVWLSVLCMFHLLLTYVDPLQPWRRVVDGDIHQWVSTVQGLPRGVHILQLGLREHVVTDLLGSWEATQLITSVRDEKDYTHLKQDFKVTDLDWGLTIRNIEYWWLDLIERKRFLNLATIFECLFSRLWHNDITSYLMFSFWRLSAMSASQWGIVWRDEDWVWHSLLCYRPGYWIHRQMQKYRGLEKCLKDITTY